MYFKDIKQALKNIRYSMLFMMATRAIVGDSGVPHIYIERLCNTSLEMQ